MKKFYNMSKLIKERRAIVNISQEELARRLKLKNGQFISNVERGLCSIPVKHFNKLSELLLLSSNETIVEAYLKDVKDSVMHEVGQ